MIINEVIEVGRYQMRIIDENFYNKFKNEYNRICRKLRKESISQRDWDKHNKLVCRRVIRRELNETFNQTVRKAGYRILKRSFTKEESEKLNKDILRLRLDGRTYVQIATELNICAMTARRRLNKVYNISDIDVQKELDIIQEYNIRRFTKNKII